MNKRTIYTVCILCALLLPLLAGCSGSVSVETGTGNTTAIVTADTAQTTQPGGDTVTTTTDSRSGETTANNTDQAKDKTTINPTTAPVGTTAMPKPPNTVTLTVQCKEAVAYLKEHPDIEGYETLVPQDGIMLKKTGIELRKNDTVLDVLKRVLDEAKAVSVIKNGYVKSINGLLAKSKDFGEQSGWLYSVNGVTPPTVGAAAYKVKAGDVIEFRFVTKFTGF